MDCFVAALLAMTAFVEAFWDAVNGVNASPHVVIASAAKQSLTINVFWDMDCFGRASLAMTAFEEMFWDSKGKKFFAPTALLTMTTSCFRLIIY
jgi:hypothetical protein